MKTIVLANAKGGTGKTTVAVNLSACLALHHGKRVLGIDLDSQGNFGISYGVDPRQLTHTAFHLLTAEAPDVRAYIKEIKPNLHLIPNGTVNLNKICHFWIHYVEVRNIASPSNCDHFR